MNCDVCFRHCFIPEHGTGLCGARTCENGMIRPASYGRVTSLALDPVEKKPLRHFYPGSMVLSVGSYGCNLRCPFCQNHEIAQPHSTEELARSCSVLSPEQLVKIAEDTRSRGNIGIAFTYNEPLVGWEYVRDTAELIHMAGMKNILVSNGTASLKVLDAVMPYIDAANIDLKGFTDRYYREVLGGSLSMVKDFIREAVRHFHVELTTLIVPGENDSPEEMRALSGWIAGLDGLLPGKDIPLHVSRFFPRFHMRDREATDVSVVYRLAEIARENLKYVYTGNC